MRVCAFTSICQDDAYWVPQYLQESERLGMDFVMHFDRCRESTFLTVAAHPRCVGITSQMDPTIEFTEQHKQAPFDKVAGLGYDWAMAWDIDETYEREAIAKIKEITALQADYVDIKWVNLWNDSRHIRVDGPFSAGHRVKFYNLQDGRRWRFDHPITNGAKLLGSDGKPLGYSIHKGGEEVIRATYPLVCLHWGMMTRKVREEHKARWDRIYTAAVGANPYQFWDFALNEEQYPPTIQEHDYL